MLEDNVSTTRGMENSNYWYDEIRIIDYYLFTKQNIPNISVLVSAHNLPEECLLKCCT